MATVVAPLRYKAKEAAAMLRLEPAYVYRLVREGVFTGLYPSGTKGPGKRIYLIPGEVEAFAGGGAAAVKRYRKANKIPEPKAAR